MSQSQSCPAFDASSTMSMANISPFAFALLSILGNQSPAENILISPYSISSALSIALAGVTPESSSQTQFTSTLGIADHGDLPLLSKSVLASSRKDGGVNLTSANGIWVRENKENPIRPEYIKKVKIIHSASVQSLTPTYDPINDFISNKTSGLITELFGKGEPVDSLIVSILINVVHFKGKWKAPFDKNNTVNGKFTTGKGQHRNCKFMTATRNLKIARNMRPLGNATMVQMDYGSERNQTEAEFSALLFLPEDNNPTSMTNLLTGLNTFFTQNPSKTLKDLMQTHLDSRKNGRLHLQKVKLFLPRFKIEYGVKSMKPHLESLGLKAPFGLNPTEPQFAEMSNDPLVYLSDVLHKAVMEVNEEGTEAAAVTAAIMMTRSMPAPVPKLTFDRPFIMMVVHVPTGTPLFVGKMEDPEFLL